jgi:PleD family two-component response regulator
VKIENLRARHESQTAKKDAEIFRLKNVELQAEIEERKKAQNALEELAQTDPLTGLFNRRYWFNAVEQILQSFSFR